MRERRVSDGCPERSLTVGTVTAVTGETPWLELDVVLDAPAWQRGKVSRVVDIAWTESPPPGARVGVDRFRSRMDWTLLRGEWNSTAVVLTDDAP